MKSILLIILFCLLLLQISYAQWLNVSNELGTSRSIYALAYNGNYIFTGGGFLDGLWLSTNNGSNWTHTSLNNIIIWSLAAFDNNVFAGTNQYGIYLSTNNGTNWTQTSLNNRTVYAFAKSGNYIFAGTWNYGVYLSTDNGTSWSQTSLNNQPVLSLAVNGNYIFAGTYPNNGIYLSTNNGTNWSQTPLNNRDIRCLAVNGIFIFAGTAGYGIYLSTDNGTSWIQSTLNNQSVYSLAVNGNYIFAGTINNGVYVSNNNGGSWTQRNEGLPDSCGVPAFCIINNYIFAGLGYHSNNGVYRRPISELTSINPVSNEIPDLYRLYQNYPNPFNPKSKIKYQIAKLGEVKLAVYNVLGEKITELVNEEQNPGTYEVEWDASNYPSGVYFYKLVVGDFIEAKKMMLLK